MNADIHKGIVRVIEGRLLQKLRQGRILRAALVNCITERWFAEVAGEIGFDLVWLDLEHCPHEDEVVGRLSLGCRATRMDLMVTLLNTAYSSARRVLESGANGIVAPHCRSVQQAQQWVNWSKFPPLGRRVINDTGVDCEYSLADPMEYPVRANDEEILILQVGNSDAIDCLDVLATVEGINALFVSTADLCMSYGIPFQHHHPLIQRAKDRVANAAAKAGKWWGTMTPTPEDAEVEIDRGARMVTCIDDYSLVVTGFRNALARFGQVNNRRRIQRVTVTKVVQ